MGGDHRVKFEKNNHNFSEKKGHFFPPMVPHMEFLFTLWYPKGSKKNWPKCHSGQTVSGQSVTSQSDTGQTVSLAKVSLAIGSLWPKCHSGQSVSGQSVILAKV